MQTINTIIKTELGGGVTVHILDVVTTGPVGGDDRSFRFEAYDHEGNLFKDMDHPKLSAALDHLHRFTATEFAPSVYVTDCEDEEYFQAYA